jgi:Arc/MetJ family transcription regulator
VLELGSADDRRVISGIVHVVKSGCRYAHIYDMGFRMKTTLNIDDTVMADLKREAARQSRTMSELVESALRLLLASRRKRGRIPALAKSRSGGALVDVADRDALYHAMEGR